MPKYLVNKKSKKLFNGSIPRYEKYKVKTLWTNPNPEIGMPNNYEISLNSDQYDYLIFIYCYNYISENIDIEMSTMCSKGKDILLVGIGYSLGSTVRRKIVYKNDLTYIAMVGVNGPQNENTDSVCIPVKIIGIKF